MFAAKFKGRHHHGGKEDVADAPFELVAEKIDVCEVVLAEKVRHYKNEQALPGHRNCKTHPDIFPVTQQPHWERPRKQYLHRRYGDYQEYERHRPAYGKTDHRRYTSPGGHVGPHHGDDHDDGHRNRDEPEQSPLVNGFVFQYCFQVNTHIFLSLTKNTRQFTLFSGN